MGNSVPRIPVPVDQIQLIPGNVLIYVDEKKANEAQSISRGDGGTHYHNLIRGRVVHVESAAYPSGPAGYPERTVPSLKPGDEVWVRARKGYPIETGDGLRLFVFNEWDVAIKLGAGPRMSRSAGNGILSGGYLPNLPPPYEEKPRMN